MFHAACNVVTHQSCRWDEDVVFRNQARGTENKGKKEFVNVGDRDYLQMF